MKLPGIIFWLSFLTIASSSSCFAQQGVVSAGGEATGVGGSVQRSTGLTDFRYFFSQDGSVQYGIQQSYQLYNLNLFAEPATGGSVESEGKYSFGQQVSLSAVVNDGYEFINWSDQDNFFLSGETSFDYIMPSKEVTLTANFNNLDDEFPAYSTLSLTMNFDDMGTIHPAEGFYKLMPGQQITLTAVPIEGMVFVNWTDGDGNVISEDSTFVYTLVRGLNTLRANFRDPAAIPLNKYAVIVSFILAMGFIMIRIYKKT